MAQDRSDFVGQSDDGGRSAVGMLLDQREWQRVSLGQILLCVANERYAMVPAQKADLGGGKAPRFFVEEDNVWTQRAEEPGNAAPVEVHGNLPWCDYG